MPPSGWTLELEPGLEACAGKPQTIKLAVGATIVGREVFPVPEDVSLGTLAAVSLGTLAAAPDLLSRRHMRITCASDATIGPSDAVTGPPVLADLSTNGVTVQFLGGNLWQEARGEVTLEPGAIITLGTRGQRTKASQQTKLDAARYRYVVCAPSAPEQSPPAPPAAAMEEPIALDTPAQPAAQPSLATAEAECESSAASASQFSTAAAAAVAAGPSAIFSHPPSQSAAPAGPEAEGQPEPEPAPTLRPASLPPAAAAAALGYEDVNATGCFSLVADGLNGTRRVPVQYTPAERLGAQVELVPYESLRAFETSGGRGWGARCEVPIREGAVVVEAVGLCLSEQAFERLEDKTCSAGHLTQRLECSVAQHGPPPVAGSWSHSRTMCWRGNARPATRSCTSTAASSATWAAPECLALTPHTHRRPPASTPARSDRDPLPTLSPDPSTADDATTQ